MSWVMFAARRYHGMRHFVVSTYLVDPEKVGRLAEIPFTCIHEVKRLALLILHGTLCQLNWISRLLEWEEAGATTCMKGVHTKQQREQSVRVRLRVKCLQCFFSPLTSYPTTRRFQDLCPLKLRIQ